MPAPDRIERSHRRLFLSLQNELATINPRPGKEVVRYQRSFRATLPKRIVSSSRRELRSKAAKAAIVLVGDFHSFRQSQKGFIRLLDEARHKQPGIVVALECMWRDWQPILDHFNAGLITVEELREETQFDRYWPFPWPNYREILEYCRRHSLPVLGLNIQSKSLRARDEAAAKEISRVIESGESSRVFALYGELHLGRRHLPASLRKRLPTFPLLTIHQNETSLYWRAPISRGQRAEVIRLGKDEFCVLNAVPWVKLRSYLDWLEGEGNEEGWLESVDTAGATREYANHLSVILHGEQKISEKVEVVGPEEISQPIKGLNREDKLLHRHARAFHRVNFLPSKEIILVPSTSTNAISEAAALLYWRSHFTYRPTSSASEGKRLLGQFMIGYLGSKILNPKRKCNEVSDLRAYLMKSRGKGVFERRKRQAFRHALHILEPYLYLRPARAESIDGTVKIEAHRLAGYVLANRLFLALRQDNKLLPFVREIFRSSLATEAWSDQLLSQVKEKIRTKKISPAAKSEAY